MNPADASLGEQICPDDPLDPGISAAVAILRAANVHTFESCEGGDDHAFRHPTIKFSGTPGEGWRALCVALNHGLRVRALERTWDLDDGEPNGPYWKLVLRRPVGP